MHLIIRYYKHKGFLVVLKQSRTELSEISFFETTLYIIF